MNLRPLSVLAVLLCAAAPFSVAQSFETVVADASAQAAAGAAKLHKKASAGFFAAQGAPAGYAKAIVCDHAPKGAPLPDGLRFYTRLDGAKSSKVPADETAAGLDDYRRSYLDGGKFHYDAWSCDTQDYWFTFDAQGLLKTTAGEKERPIRGHARVETRGQVDWEGDLDCRAVF